MTSIHLERKIMNCIIKWTMEAEIREDLTIFDVRNEMARELILQSNMNRSNFDCLSLDKLIEVELNGVDVKEGL